MNNKEQKSYVLFGMLKHMNDKVISHYANTTTKESRSVWKKDTKFQKDKKHIIQ